MPVQPEFRFRDRWQTSLADAWRNDRDDKGGDQFFRLLISLLEQRDRELEDYLNARLTLDTPGVRARASAATSVAHNTNTYLPFDTEDYDTDAFHSTSTNNSRLTVPAGLAGTYVVGFSVLFAAGTQTTSAWIEVNRAATRFAWQQTPNDATNGTLLQGSDFLGLNAGDYIEARVFQNSGGAINVNGNTSCSFWMFRVGP